MSLTILTHNSPEYQPLAELTLPDKWRYAIEWGHKLDQSMPIDPRGIGWSKVRFLMSVPVNPDQWYMWMGCDAVFARHDIDVRKYCNPEFDLVICKNGAGQFINSDVFLCRATEAMIKFFAAVWAEPGGTQFHEQDAMTTVIRRQDCPCAVDVREDRAINGLPQWAGPYAYRPGDFIAHAAGGDSVKARVACLRPILFPVAPECPLDFARERATTNWRHGYHLLPNVINALDLHVGVEIGVAFAGHADAILSRCPGVTNLYGVDSYRHRAAYDDLMNLPQAHLDAMHDEAVVFMRGKYGDRFEMVRMTSLAAAYECKSESPPSPVDFIYIDAEHTYEACKADIAAWWPLIRPGGILSGHDYGGYLGVTQAVNEFAAAHRLELQVPEPHQYFWWMRKP